MSTGGYEQSPLETCRFDIENAAGAPAERWRSPNRASSPAVAGTDPITRLVSPSDIGEMIKPFVFLDHAEVAPRREPLFGIHPHSGIATLTMVLQRRPRLRGHDRKEGLGPDGWTGMDESRKRRLA